MYIIIKDIGRELKIDMQNIHAEAVIIRNA